ncbi:hypothetical protein Tco_0425108, partial [Tanacetum coccineum]
SKTGSKVDAENTGSVFDRKLNVDTDGDGIGYVCDGFYEDIRIEQLHLETVFKSKLQNSEAATRNSASKDRQQQYHHSYMNGFDEPLPNNSSEANLRGRLLESFQEDAKYENVGQDIRSQGGKDDQDKQGKDLEISKSKTKSKDNDKGSR